ncbi:non-ribosomal peptide synthetase [Streptomyces sp. PSAA01]|uniref:non-ribosomal peptide synthetase n=1 Tax=Streptomyces sp. PSAA01 TaxID=2912762 RepID=UPI001F475C94|nr:non-ribosomal peptide synthetase [Streptomyces sp. PSAA01]MCG0284488.1 non-ribosomal peptide synthetase [Streptomyces sp. PSAA01]
MSAAERAWCHAISIPLAGTVDPEVLAARYAAIVRRHGDLDAPETLWVDQVPANVRQHRLAAEVALPVPQGLRAALLTGDDRCDLVLAADRAVAGRRDLDLLVTAVSDGGPDPDWRRRPAASIVTAEPEWGLGGTGHGSGTLDLGPWAAGAEPATWLAALAIVLDRYGDDNAMAAVLDTTTVQMTGPVGEATTLKELVDRFRSPTATTDKPVSVGLVFDTDPPAAGEYRPWLSRPFPLTVGVGRARLAYEHGAGVTSEMAAQFVRHLARTHQQVIDSPRLRVCDVDPFDEAEQRRALAPCDLAGPGAGDAAARIEDTFAARVAEQPDAVALCYQLERVTYRELDAVSTRLAGGLRRIGVRAGDRVGICLDRSTSLVTTMLAILKAGCAFVPMDPSYPAERLTYISTDAGLDVVVTTHEAFPARPGLRVVHPDELAAQDGEAVDHEPSTAPTDPAYLIYTSGSTGRPKGVVVPHANVIALLAATRDDFGLSPADVWTLFHSSAFDFSVWEIWGCLLTGGRLVVVPFWASRSPAEFHDLLIDEKVTVLNQTPSAFSQLLAVEQAQQRSLTVRLVIFGGEPLDSKMLLPWLDRYPETQCRVVNMFGITETTVHVTAETVTRGSALAGSRSVGRALPGWQVHVLGPDGTLLPPGVRGEIYVGGVGLALGYLNRPELQAERFVDNPFGSGRLYRSGDAGRLHPDGRLEHLGRIDNQVKVRGFRIELDEIRSVLLEDRAVVAAAVVLRSGDAATIGIDAYVVLDGSSAAEVRGRAARLLPDYMIPTSVTAVPSIPLTTNGKLDVSRLPTPAMPVTEHGGDEPHGSDDALIRDLQEVWSTVLGVQVGPDDDFFDLGGNSLLAVRLAARSSRLPLPKTSIRMLYQHRTIRQFVTAARAAASTQP